MRALSLPYPTLEQQGRSWSRRKVNQAPIFTLFQKSTRFDLRPGRFWFRIEPGRVYIFLTVDL